MAVSYGIFHFMDGEFMVETSGGQCHSRACVDDLKSLFHAGPDEVMSVKDLRAHWYEAQLLHYGLPPSKVKGTAVMRLLDELNKGNLSVPKRILKLEERLKREWYNEDTDEEPSPEVSEAKQTLLAQTSDRPLTSAKDFDLDFSRLSLKERGEDNKVTPEHANKSLYILGSDATQRVSTPKAGAQLRPSPRTTNRCSNSSSSQKIKSEEKSKEQAERPSPSPARSPGYVPLGLINGVYSISCPGINGQHGSSESSIILCLDSPCVWGAYDFGLYLGSSS